MNVWSTYVLRMDWSIVIVFISLGYAHFDKKGIVERGLSEKSCASVNY